MDWIRRCRKRFAAFNIWHACFAALIVLHLVGCAASFPVMVNLMDKGRQYTATLEVSKSADEIYRIVVRELEKIPDVRIVRKDDSKFFVEASRADRNTRITASPAGNGKSRVTITADAGNTWEESKDLASRAVRRICEEVQMRCQLIVK
jgi:hypothetical protein